ncbi:MAG: head completion protein [Euryarchaeota archaeon]|jgi:hypothetical protein|nr:head completion protein [Euryarchaeota archaeon]|tara:strand:+ start:229 stop:669 length:441 start_codon:yes stop_codon:yes gene_type:complete
MAHKGKYKVKNRSKYVGAVDNVVYRSSWERRFMVYADTSKKVIKWNSEELVIPYVSPVDGKVHRYFPDFWIQSLSEDGKISNIIIEVKPKGQCQAPKMGKTAKSKYRYLRELKTWKVNEAKWDKAREFCEDRKWEFKILTEDHLVR